MTGQPCPYGFGPGSIAPYGFNGSNASAFSGSFNQTTGSYQVGVIHPAHDWQNKSYAYTTAAPPPVEPYTACPKHIDFLDHQQQCREIKALKTFAGAAVGAYGSGLAASGPCSALGPVPGAACAGVAAGVGGTVGGRLGYLDAKQHPSCIVVDGGGRCVDASHRH